MGKKITLEGEAISACETEHGQWYLWNVGGYWRLCTPMVTLTAGEITMLTAGILEDKGLGILIAQPTDEVLPLIEIWHGPQEESEVK